MKTIFSLILSLVILITSMGFTVSSHVCGGKKVKSVVSLGTADVSCGMEKKANNCSTKPIMKDNCCEDEFKLIQNDEDFTQQVTSVDFSPHFLIAFVISYVELFDNETTETDFFADHSPPPLIKDIPVLMQTFLI
jgi:hypothetical protein